jgi:hypothetical protein
MYKYGTHYVRGGSYSDENITQETTQFLLNELETAEDENDSHSVSYDYLLKEVLYKPWTRKEIQDEKIKVLENLQKYKAEESLYENLIKIKHGNSKIVNLNIITHLDDIEWLRNYCLQVHEESKQTQHKHNEIIWSLPNHSNEKIRKYKELLNLISHINRNRHIHITSTKYDAQTVYFTYPIFLLDDFFYHKHRTHLSCSVDKVLKYCDALQYFIVCLVNRADECFHDICTWFYDIKWLTPRKIYLLEMLEKNIQD